MYGTGLPTEAGKFLESGAINGIAFWDPKLAGVAMNKVAKMLVDGKTVQNGCEPRSPGYTKVTVSKGPGKGVIVRGQAGSSVDKSNYKQYQLLIALIRRGTRRCIARLSGRDPHSCKRTQDDELTQMFLSPCCR